MSSRDDFLQQVATVAAELASPTVEKFCDRLAALKSSAEASDLTPLTGTGQPEVRARFAALVRAWRELAPDLSPESLAWALRAANRTDEWHRARQSLEVVWSGPTADATAYRRTDQALLELIQTARKTLLIATFAAYKVPQLAAAMVQAAGRGIRVTLVLESAEESEGKLTFSAIRALGPELAKVADVYVWPTEAREVDASGQRGALHAKCAVADETCALISSANLTEHAMNLNMELGLLVRGGDTPRALERHLRGLISCGTLLSCRARVDEV